MMIQCSHGYELVWPLNFNSKLVGDSRSLSLLTFCRSELCHLRRRLARHGSAHLAQKLAKRRLQLQNNIDAFLARTPTALGSLLPEDHVPISGTSHEHLEEEDDDMEDDGLVQDLSKSDEDEEDDNDHDGDGDDDSGSDADGEDDGTGEDIDMEVHIKSTPSPGSVPESIVLPLPSHLGINKHQDPTVAALSAEELIIRQTQASESLQHLRLSLGMKCGIFRTMKSNPRSQKTKTRAWKAVHDATAAVEQYARSYCLAQNALVQLTENPSLLSKFPPLRKQDLTLSRDILEENRLGQRSEHLSWVWRLDIGKDQDEDAWMHESE
jgi:hypothetical protein